MDFTYQQKVNLLHPGKRSKQTFKIRSVEHKLEIALDDVKILSATDCLGMSFDNPCGLQRKKWLDIMHFLYRRGRKNLRSIRKNTFAVSRDAAGREYVHQVIDEADKNHGLGDPTCPVAEFKKYVGKQSSDIDMAENEAGHIMRTSGHKSESSIRIIMSSFTGQTAPNV
ncbi:hypothetical protein MAR_019587 [Mya arenaria]|uniref:Tyr recombinase domain-containing protein n=1 Tax=Mya arenaria TaxID=6604 RepID=A0ABY7E2J2_MYAAR|nr:hypothetical protein MAR_019587 [Mya arenaria]